MRLIMLDLFAKRIEMLLSAQHSPRRPHNGSKQSNQRTQRPPNRGVPFGNLLGPKFRIDLHVLQGITYHLSWLGITDPLLKCATRFGKSTKHPRCILLQDFYHLCDDLRFFIAIRQVAHSFKECVICWVDIVGGIFTALACFGIWTVEQKQKVFCIGIISDPAPHIHLSHTSRHFFLKAVVVSGAHIKLNTNIGELASHPIEGGARTTRTTCRIKMQDERRTRFFIPAIWIARFGQQATRLVERLALWLTVLDVVDHAIKPRLATHVTEDTGRDRTIGDLRLIILKDRDKLFPIKGDAECLT